MSFFTGFLIGIFSLIPGISGGTILVLTRQHEIITNAIINFKKRENHPILFFLLLGILLGTLSFARIIEFCFYFAPNCTFILFSGFVLFSIPDFVHTEKIKPNIIFFFLGLFLIFYLSTFQITEQPIIVDFPKITLPFLLLFTFFGMLDGFCTILPGISGSMVMMILGPYFLYKSYLAQLSFSTLIYLIPLFCYLLGDILGFFLGSKFFIHLLKKQRKRFMNFVLGMMIASSIILLPFYNLNFHKIVLYIIVLLISFLITEIFNLFKNS